jgi:hypothetical protein
MRFLDPPTLDSPWRGQPADDLEQLLFGFFRQEMPNPWPNVPAVEERPVLKLPEPPTVRPLPRPAASWRHRLALAASVALLITGPFLLSGRFADMASSSTSISAEDANADRRGGQPDALIVTPAGASVQVKEPAQPEKPKPQPPMENEIDELR